MSLKKKIGTEKKYLKKWVIKKSFVPFLCVIYANDLWNGFFELIIQHIVGTENEIHHQTDGRLRTPRGSLLVN